MHAIWHGGSRLLISLVPNTYQTHFRACECSHTSRGGKNKRQPNTLWNITSLLCFPPLSREQLSAHANNMMVGGYANAISLDLHSTTANGCTDGRQQRRARHLWQRERLAAILSEAVPIWKETTTLHYRDDGSSLGAVGALCCCCCSQAALNTLKAKHIQSIHTHIQTSLFRF